MCEMGTTYHNVTINGMHVGVPNLVDDTPVGYYISYNNWDVALYGSDTTAIVVQKSGAFLILNGDHRDKLRGLSLLDACEYFHANVKSKNFRSDNHELDIFTIFPGGKCGFVRGTWE